MADSISEWIGRLKAGDAEAAQNLWDRYAQALVKAARKKLGGVPRTVADEEDVAQSVFSSICRGAAAGRFSDVRSRDELWWLLLSITTQKVVDHIRRELAQKRGGGQVQTESQLADDRGQTNRLNFDNLIGKSPTPDFLVLLDEQYNRLLDKLGDARLQEIAVSRVEGYTVAEIAARLAIGTRAVERKLQLIRTAWSRDFSEIDVGP
jgi:DNA-directed RNA polymerase specialized sigma24 family protein